MTTKELSLFFGKTKQTVLSHAKKQGVIIENGKEKEWTKEEVEKVARSIYKSMPVIIKESIDSTFKKSIGRPNENLTVEKSIKDIINAILVPIMKQQNEFNNKMFDEMRAWRLQSTGKQIENKTEQLTAREFFNRMNITVFNPEGFISELGKIATLESKNQGRAIQFDTKESQYPVGRYDIDILKHALSMMRVSFNLQPTLFDGEAL